jgi:hypothetical protein
MLLFPKENTFLLVLAVAELLVGPSLLDVSDRLQIVNFFKIRFEFNVENSP